MVDARTLRLLVPRPIRRFPADLAAVVAIAAAACLLPFVPGVRETPLRIVAGLAFVLFLPGYAFTAALFPERQSSRTSDESVRAMDESARATGDGERTTDENGRTLLPRPTDGVDAFERVVLSFGLSFAVVPLLVLLLNFTPWGIRFASVLLAVGGFTVAAATLAAVRRWRVPPGERFRPTEAVPVPSLRGGLLASDGRLETAVNLVLVASVLVATAGAVYAVATPQERERFTEFYVVTESEDGTVVANDYPNGTGGEPVVVGITNRERERTDYTVVVQAQQLGSGDGATEVVERRELDRFEATLDHGEEWREAHAPEPTLSRDDVRIQYLLYRGSAPETPERANAYRATHFWVNASDPPE